jgi:anaerobic selenocysteine-containing dehydrogenase
MVEEAIVKSACRMCHGVCQVNVHLRNNKVIKISGDKSSPTSRGYICPKGIASPELLYHPDRITKYVGTGKYPWKPVTKSEVLENIKYLKKEKIKIVALSSHDSCDLSISLFKNEFRNRFKPIIVGESIVV